MAASFDPFLLLKVRTSFMPRVMIYLIQCNRRLTGCCRRTQVTNTVRMGLSEKGQTSRTYRTRSALTWRFFPARKRSKIILLSKLDLIRDDFLYLPRLAQVLLSLTCWAGAHGTLFIQIYRRIEFWMGCVVLRVRACVRASSSSTMAGRCEFRRNTT